MEKEREEVPRESFERDHSVRTVVLDTDVLIDHAHRLAPWINEILKDRNNYIAIVPTVVVAEYLTTQEEEIKISAERSKKYLALFHFQDFTYNIAEVLGRILRRKTYVQEASFADLIIASTCLYLDGELATRNKKDFAKIPHLRFFDPKNLL
ncbi:PIN domain-containing protein [Candidatus Gottesmanbacteria bacterium]|nr:PIN domain-containing protein [Candidatus Gottesmanbacteria bacterium]